MADNSVDGIIADPPYGINYQNSWGGKKSKKIANDTAVWTGWIAEAARRSDGETMSKALGMVYLVPGPVEWGEIERRVCSASMAIPADRSTVFQALARACIMFAEERGLRM